jgi:hypothetical protein
MISDNDSSKLLGFQIDKEITRLFKKQLEELENIRAEHLISMEKLKAILPKEQHKLLDAADFLSNNTYELKRKRILDAGNEAKRQALSYLPKFIITLK